MIACSLVFDGLMVNNKIKQAAMPSDWHLLVNDSRILGVREQAFSGEQHMSQGWLPDLVLGLGIQGATFSPSLPPLFTIPCFHLWCYHTQLFWGVVLQLCSGLNSFLWLRYLKLRPSPLCINYSSCPSPSVWCALLKINQDGPKMTFDMFWGRKARRKQRKVEEWERRFGVKREQERGKELRRNVEDRGWRGWRRGVERRGEEGWGGMEVRRGAGEKEG